MRNLLFCFFVILSVAASADFAQELEGNLRKHGERYQTIGLGFFESWLFSNTYVEYDYSSIAQSIIGNCKDGELKDADSFFSMLIDAHVNYGRRGPSRIGGRAAFGANEQVAMGLISGLSEGCGEATMEGATQMLSDIGDLKWMATEL